VIEKKAAKVNQMFTKALDKVLPPCIITDGLTPPMKTPVAVDELSVELGEAEREELEDMKAKAAIENARPKKGVFKFPKLYDEDLLRKKLKSNALFVDHDHLDSYSSSLPASQEQSGSEVPGSDL